MCCQIGFQIQRAFLGVVLHNSPKKESKMIESTVIDIYWSVHNNLSLNWRELADRREVCQHIF